MAKKKESDVLKRTGKTTIDKQIDKAILNTMPKNIVEVDNLFRTGSTDKDLQKKLSGPRIQKLPITKTSDGDIKINASDEAIANFVKNEDNRIGFQKKQDEAKRNAQVKSDVVSKFGDRPRTGRSPYKMPSFNTPEELRNYINQSAKKTVSRNAFDIAKDFTEGKIKPRNMNGNQMTKEASVYANKSYSELTDMRHNLDAKLRRGSINPDEAKRQTELIDMWRIENASKAELEEMRKGFLEQRNIYAAAAGKETQTRASYNRGLYRTKEKQEEFDDNIKKGKKESEKYSGLIAQIDARLRDYEIDEDYEANFYNYGRVALESGADDKYVPTKYENEDYDAINGWFQNKPKNKEHIERVGRKNYIHLTDGELKLYNTLYNHNPEKAEEYLKGLKNVLERRAAQAETEQAAEFASEHPYMAAVGAVGAQFIGGLPSAVDNIAEAVTGEVNTYDASSRMMRTAQALQSEGRNTIKKRHGEAAAFLYDGVIEFGNMAANILVAKGAGALGAAAGASAKAINVASRAAAYSNMFGRAASGTMISIADRGGNTAQILLGGTAVGLTEILTESLPFEEFLNPKVTGKYLDAIKSGIKQTGSNAAEELIAEASGIILDAVVMQGNSENERMCRELMMQGMSEEEARKAVFRETAKQLGYAAGMGGLMGGSMGTVTSLIETASHNGYMKNVGEEMINNPQAFWAVLKIADENGITNQFNLQSEKDVGKMVESVISQSIEKNGSLANIIRSVAAIEGRDADYIGSKESLGVARAVIAMAEGKVSAEQRNIISQSRGAVTLLTAIENNNEALGSIKNAAAEEYAKVNAKNKGLVQMQNAESEVKSDTKGKTVGLVMNDVATELDKGIRANIQTFAERTGSTVIVEHGLVDEKGEAIMGDEKDGVIRINADYADAAHSITVHEFTHRMQNIAPKASENFKNYVVSKMKNEGTYESAMAKLREDYQGLSDEKLIDELCAETAERLFRDEAELTDFIKKDRTLAEWVKDVWLNVLDMLGRTDERTHAQLMWKKCVNEATRAKDKGVTTDEVRYKKSGIEAQNDNILPVYDEKTGQFTVDEKVVKAFGEKVDAWLYGKVNGDEYFELGDTPIILYELGAENLPVEFGNNVMWKMTGGRHGIAIEDIKELPRVINNPLMVFKSSTVDDAFVVITELFDKAGDPVIAAIHLNKLKKHLRINRVASVYGKENIDNFLKKEIENQNLRYIDKIKSQEWSQSRGLQLPQLAGTNPDNNIILQKEDIVNMYSMQNGGNNSDSSQKRPGVSEKLDEYINKFGEMEKGKGPRRDVSVPKRTEKNNRVRQFARTAGEATTLSEETSEGVLENVAEGKLSYVPISNKRAMDYAYSTLDAMGFEWVEKKVNGAIANHSFDKNTVAMAEVLLQSYDEMGDQERAQQLIVDFAAEATRMGQSIQAISMLKKLDKNYEVIYIDKIVENLKEEIIERNAKWYRRNKTDADSIEVSEDLKNALREAKTEAEREAIREEIYEELANQLPPTWVDRWNAWRYFAMLGNARTHVRNMLGNAFFMPMICAKNVSAKLIESVGSAIAGEKMKRSKTFIVPKKYRDFAKEDAIGMREQLSGGGKHNPADIIRDKQKLFPKGLEWMRVKVGDALEWEDWIFLKHHYKVALSNYLAANKVDLENASEEVMQKARYRAMQEAQRNTYRDLSVFANKLSKLSKQNAASAILVEGLMPFKKTPVNVLKRGVEYSPVGLLKTLTFDMVKVAKGDITASEYIDRICCGLTGTGVVALGMLFNSLGYIVGSYDDDKEKEFEKLQGIQNYSLVIGEHSYTLDWLAPFSLPFFVGVELQNMLESEKGINFRDSFKALTNITEPFFEMSMLQGISGAVDTIKAANSAETFGSFALNAAENYFGQAVPTFFGQIARTIDDTQRRSYDDKNIDIPQAMQYFAQTQAKKIPGVSKKMQPYVDEWGRKKVTDGVFKRALINMLSPGYYTKIESSEMEEELKRLYDEVGNEDGMSLFPSAAVKKFNLSDDTEKNLTAEEYTTMQEVQGQSAYKLLTGITDSEAYAELDDVTRGKIVTNTYKLAKAAAKKAVAGDDWSGDKWIEEALTLMDDDYGAAEDFLIYYTLKNDDAVGEKGARSFAFENLDDIPSEYWESSLSESAAKKYDEFIKDSGVGIEEFISIQDYKGKLKTIDKDTPNEITPKEQMTEYLDGLDLSTDDYRRVWKALGYSARTCPR